MNTPEIGAGLKPDLPSGRWTLVLRLSDVVYEPISSSVKDFLDGFTLSSTPESISHRTAAILDEPDGVIYYRYDTKSEAEGLQVVEEAVPPLLNGLEILDLNLDVQARIDRTDAISPSRPLGETFGYMLFDITDQVDAARQAMKLQPFEIDSDELDHLLDH
jgi:hypothetical protein